MSDTFYHFSCGTTQLKSILEYLEHIEDDIGCLTEKVEDLTNAHDVHEKQCFHDNDTMQEKMASMQNKVTEIRQLVGVNALSKGVATHKVISEMKRGSIIDHSGFMVPSDDLKGRSSIVEENGEDVTERKKSPQKRRSRSPTKKRSASPTKTVTKPVKQGWEYREEERKAMREKNVIQNGHAVNDTENNVESPIKDRPRAARSKSRAAPGSPRKRTRSPTKKLEAIRRRMSADIESYDGSDESLRALEEMNGHARNVDDIGTNSGSDV